MNNFIKITFILSLIASCDMETVIDLEIPQDPPMIVLNGVLDTDTTINVIISYNHIYIYIYIYLFIHRFFYSLMNIFCDII